MLPSRHPAHTTAAKQSRRPPPRARHVAAPPKLPQQQQQQHQHSQHHAAAAPSGSHPFDALAAWLTANGGSVTGISAGDCRMGAVTVRGLVAQQDLPAGTQLISVPLSSTLRDDRAPTAYPGAPWNASLAAHLLAERSKGPGGSRLAPYLDTLPQHCASPLLLPEQLLQEVQYKPAVKALRAFQGFARESYAAAAAAAAGGGGAAQQQPGSWAEWCWALHMVQSRSIRLAIAGCKVMIPGIDLLNHGGSAANGQLVLGRASWQLEGEPAVVFVTTADIAAGQQVLWSYGSRGNDDFFAYHGFALPDNPDEDVELFESSQQLAAWAVEALPGLRGLQQRHSPQQLAAVADAAAGRAQQEAAARCSSAAIPGTTSSLLMPLGPLLAQQQGDPGSSEAAVLAAVKAAALQRRLASFRLHRPEWGTSDCPAVAPELVLKADGHLDVRVPAVLAALQDLASSSGGSTTAEAAAGVRQLLAQRCEQLLSGFGSSVQDDDAWLQRGGGSSSDWDATPALAELMCAVVQYRRGKKLLLHSQLATLHG